MVIGGGAAGLAASYDLIRAGHRVTILEAAPGMGGLAGSITLEGQKVERFYHFICRADQHLIQFVQELGLEDRLHWRQTHTAFYHDGRGYTFGTPFDLLFFSPVPWLQRFRFGLHIIRSRYRSQWRWLDQMPAKPWLIETIGEQAYQVIWDPLLSIKFGAYQDKISAAWVWHRIWRVAKSRRRVWERESFGYLENGSATLVEHLESWLRKQPAARIKTNTPVKAVEIQDGVIKAVITKDERIPCDALISTLALPNLDKLIPEEGRAYFANARQIKYIGVVCALLSLKRPFSRNFWMNINDSTISFNGIIEQTNLNRHLQESGLNLIYIPFYLPTDEPRYRFDEETLLREYLPMLARINPDFNEGWIKESFVFRTPHAQAICTTGFSELIPQVSSPIGGLYVTDSSQFYPEDRTISAAIRQGRKAASMIIESQNGAS